LSVTAFIVSAIAFSSMMKWKSDEQFDVSEYRFSNDTNLLTKYYGDLASVSTCQSVAQLLFGILGLNVFSLHRHSYFFFTRTLESASTQLLAIFICYWIFAFSFSVFLTQVFANSTNI